MLPGRPDVKYGLQLSNKVQKRQEQASKAKNKQLPPPPSIFDDEEPESVESEIARQALKKRAQKEVEQQHAAALKEDSSVFDYDGVYDEMKKPKETKEAVQRQSRYIGKLLDKAKAREREQDIIYERLLSKERAKEDHLYGDKEKFVTRAYKEKLAEQAMWLEQEKRREALEAADDVTKKEDLGDFYRNLLQKNVAFGGKVEEVRQPPPNATSAVGRPPVIGPTLPSEDRQESSAAAGPGISRAVSEEREPHIGKRTIEGRDAQPDESREQKQREAEGDAEGNSVRHTVERPSTVAAKTSDQSEAPSKAAAEEKAAAARERYLARKKQRT